MQGGFFTQDRATTRGRPIYDVYDSVEMIGHDNIFISLNRRKFVGYLLPPCFYHQPAVIQVHPALQYLPEYTISILCANREKIPTIL